jgi:transketolase
VALVLTRQDLPILDRRALAPASGLVRGGYTLADGKKPPDLVLIASGSEVCLALEARELLAAKGVQARVVSLPSWELFERQPQEYRDDVLPPCVEARLAIEAAAPFGWERWIGARGDSVAVRRFGASAPGKVLMEKFGFTAENVAQRALAVLEKITRRPAADRRPPPAPQR